MAISMYSASIPTLIRMLDNLSKILEKGAAHAESRKIDPAVLVGGRLYPDMFPLSRQVQIASDTAKGCAARLAGKEPPKFEDNETTFEELIARCSNTVAFLETLKAADIDGSESREVTLQLRSGPLKFDGLSYLNEFVLPNFFFHVATAYDILRHNGVELGKRDYMGN